MQQVEAGSCWPLPTRFFDAPSSRLFVAGRAGRENEFCTFFLTLTDSAR